MGGSVGVGGGYQKKVSAGRSNNFAYPSWAKDFFTSFQKPGQQSINAFDPTGGPLRQQAADELSRNVNGYYVDPANDPTLTPMVNAIQRGGQEAFDRYSNQISTGAQRTGGLFSTSALKQKEEAARRTSDDVAGQIANLYGNIRGQERARQFASTAPATNFGLLPLNQALSIAALYKGLEDRNRTSNVGHGWDVSGNVGAGA